MTLFQPAFRVRVYKPHPDEDEVLVPAAGAPHSEAFQVATISGLSGYQPFLGLRSGRTGKLNVTTKRTDVGQVRYTLLDKRTGGPLSSNAARWFTGFMGDTGGRENLKGLLWIEEERDATGAWVRSLTGRIHAYEFDDPLTASITVREETSQLVRRMLWETAPDSSITYAVMHQLMPLGRSDEYGPWKGTPPLRGTIVAAAGAFPAFVQIQADHAQRDDNLVTEQLHSLLSQPWERAPDDSWLGPPGIRCRLKRLDTSATGEFSIRAAPYGYTTNTFAVRPDGKWRSLGWYILPRPEAGSMAVPPGGTLVEVSLVGNAEVSETNPIYLDDVDPIVLLQDIFDGKFWRPHEDGSLKEMTYVDFSALEGKLPTQRFAITKITPAFDWIEKNILQPNNLSIRTDVQGRMTVFSLDLPASLGGLATLTEADLAGVPKWSTTAAFNVFEFTLYDEAQVTPAEAAQASGLFPRVPPQLVRGTAGYVTQASDRLEIGVTHHRIDGTGYRSAADEIQGGRRRADLLTARAQGYLSELRRMFGDGAHHAIAPLRRNATTKALGPGQFVLVTFPALPDFSTLLRGGTRLMLVEEATSQPLGPIEVRLLDTGLSVLAAVPALSALGQESGNERHGIEAAVTVNAASNPVRVDIAVTDTGTSSAPAADSPLWHFAARAPASGTVTMRDLPSGSRIWVRARSEPAGPLQLPSAWVFAPGGTEYVDTDVTPAPTSLAESGVLSTLAVLTWTVGDAALPVELLHCSPSGGTPELVLTLPPGTSRHVLYDLPSNTSQEVHVRHPDGHGGYSAPDDVVFSTNTTDPVSAAPPAVALLAGLSV